MTGLVARGRPRWWPDWRPALKSRRSRRNGLSVPRIRSRTGAGVERGLHDAA